MRGGGVTAGATVGAGGAEATAGSRRAAKAGGAVASQLWYALVGVRNAISGFCAPARFGPAPADSSHSAGSPALRDASCRPSAWTERGPMVTVLKTTKRTKTPSRAAKRMSCRFAPPGSSPVFRWSSSSASRIRSIAMLMSGACHTATRSATSRSPSRTTWSSGPTAGSSRSRGSAASRKVTYSPDSTV